MLSTTLLLVCVATILVAQVFILRSAVRTAAVPREGSTLPRPRRAAEVAWAILPAIALLLVLWMTWRESRAAVTPPAIHQHDSHEGHTS